MDADEMKDAIATLEKTGQLGAPAPELEPERVEQLLLEAGKLAEELKAREPQVASGSQVDPRS